MADSLRRPAGKRQGNAAAHRHAGGAARRDDSGQAPVKILLLVAAAIAVASIHPALELVAFLGEAAPPV
jgi:hypothetical protein